MTLTTADFVLVCCATAGLVFGGFAGFSGALSFVAASACAACAGRFVWPWSSAFLAQDWARVLATLVAVLVVFGLVRALVRKLANLALKQPADFIFGALVGATAAGALALATAWGIEMLGLFRIDSSLLSETKALLG